MDELRPASSNIPEYTVSEISGAVRRTLEGSFGRVRVRGEITELKRPPSGHIYLALKDEGARIAAVAWKSTVPRLGMKPENGVEVVATGRITAYGERSSYQLIIDRLEYAGIGALLARIEMLRTRLTAEGLFAAEAKRALPLLPAVVGVVTSESGAVIQDIRTTIARRFPRRILLWPVPVQGEGAASRIAAAIAGFDALDPAGPIPRPAVLIVARGGGSLEDLMAFNEEIVVRAVARCRIPVISAVGHETDTTLIDFVADRRAPTPTAAAEMAVPVRADLVVSLARTHAQLLGNINRWAGERRLAMERLARRLPELPMLLGQARQRLDDRGERLDNALPNLIMTRRSELERVERRLPDPAHVVRQGRVRLRAETMRLALALPNFAERQRSGVALCGQRLDSGLRHASSSFRGKSERVFSHLSPAHLLANLRVWRTRADGAGLHLEAVSPLAILKRGYVVVFDDSGHMFTASGQVQPSQRLRLRFCDGVISARAEGPAQAERQGRLAV